MKNIVLYALIGAAAGLAVAHFFPSLGKAGLDKGFSDIAFGLGAKKPYAMDAGIGAALGALIGFLTQKKSS